MKSTAPFGLLAQGSTPLWDVTVDESLTGDPAWIVQIEGRHAEVVFQLKELEVISQAIDYLDQRLNDSSLSSREQSSESLCLGTFGRSAVSLAWDNENFIRCFLTVIDNERAAFRLVLLEDETRMLRDALRQVQADL